MTGFLGLSSILNSEIEPRSIAITVKKLMELLKDCDPDYEVCVPDKNHQYNDVYRALTDVIVKPAYTTDYKNLNGSQKNYQISDIKGSNEKHAVFLIAEDWANIDR